MSSRREPPPDFRRPLDERLGAVVSAIVVLGGVTGAFCVLAGRFDDPRPLSNAGVLLGMVACVMLALIAAAARLDDGMRRRLMLCAVLSLSAHLAFGLTFDLRYLASHRARDGTSSVEGGDPAPKPHLPADWQAASPIGYVSAFESPVPTAAARDESLPSQKQPAEAAVLAERMRDVADPSFQPDAALPARIAEQLRPNLDAPAAPVSRQERRDEVASVRPIAEPRFAPRPSRALEMPDPSVAASRQSRPRPSSKAPVVSPETIAAAVPAFSPQTPPPARSEPAPETADETMPLGARHQAPGLELAGALELPLPKGATDRAPPLIEPPPEATAKILATAPEARRSTAESRTPLPHDWQTLPVATPTLRRTSASPETTELAGPIRRAPSNISAPAIRVETPAAPAPIAISSPDAPLELASRAPLDASRRPMGRLSPSTTGLAIAPEPRADATAIEPDVHRAEVVRAEKIEVFQADEAPAALSKKPGVPTIEAQTAMFVEPLPATKVAPREPLAPAELPVGRMLPASIRAKALPGAVFSQSTPTSAAQVARRTWTEPVAINDRLPAATAIDRSVPGVRIDTYAPEAPVKAFRQRNPQTRKETAKSHGGTEGAERTVEFGLEYLARVQMPDGRWSLDAAPPSLGKAGDPALGQMQSDTAATGLALLAYLGAGYTHRGERYASVVDRGLTWLIDRQRPDGDLFAGGNRFTRLYSHGIGAIALCEAYGMTRDLRLREPASRAIRFVVDAQSPELGGWRYVPREESDTSVTGWQLMAMASARMSGLDVPEQALAKVDKWLDLAGSPDGARYAYNPHAADTPQQRTGRSPNLPMTAEGLLMRMYQGWPSSNPALRAGADYILANLPDQGTAEQPRRDAYYWYYATQVMFHMEGTYWHAWNERLRPMLERTQVRGGPWAGSWHPTEPVPDRWGAAAGRLYVTSMHLLVLEVYYRHLPLFRHPQIRHPRPK